MAPITFLPALQVWTDPTLAQLGWLLALRLEGLEGIGRRARAPGIGEPAQIVLPQRLPAAAELVQILPIEQPGAVTVIEDDLDGIVADLLQVADIDVLLADLQLGLIRRVAAHLGRRGVDPQILARQAEAGAVVVGDLQHV